MELDEEAIHLIKKQKTSKKGEISNSVEYFNYRQKKFDDYQDEILKDLEIRKNNFNESLKKDKEWYNEKEKILVDKLKTGEGFEMKILTYQSYAYDAPNEKSYNGSWIQSVGTLFINYAIEMLNFQSRKYTTENKSECPDYTECYRYVILKIEQKKC